MIITIDTTKWVTLERFADMKKVSPETVLNWVGNGKVKALHIPEFNLYLFKKHGLLGKARSKNAVKKMVDSRNKSGYGVDSETKKKIAEAVASRHSKIPHSHSEQTKKKIAEAMKKNWQLRR
jgi:hypothetical protein